MCSTLSTVYVTAPSTVITKTVYAASSLSPEPSVSVVGAAQSSLATSDVTVTHYVSSTETITLLEAASTAIKKDEGPYSFSKHVRSHVLDGWENPTSLQVLPDYHFPCDPSASPSNHSRLDQQYAICSSLASANLMRQECY